MKQLHMEAAFYRWFVKQTKRDQERLLKLLEKGYTPHWDASRQTWVLKRP